MAITEAWSKTDPQEGETPKLGASEMRQHWRALEERFIAGGHNWNTGVDTKDGRHCVGIADASRTTQFDVYDSAKTTIVWTIDDATAHKFYGSSTYFSHAIKRGSFAIPLTIPGAIPGRCTGIIWRNQRGNDATDTQASVTLVEAKLICWTTPSSGSLEVDIKKLTSGFTDPTSGGTSLFTLSTDRPRITAGNRVGTTVTPNVAGANVIAAGDAIVFEITALNAATDIVLILLMQAVS